MDERERVMNPLDGMDEAETGSVEAEAVVEAESPEDTSAGETGGTAGEPGDADSAGEAAGEAGESVGKPEGADSLEEESAGEAEESAGKPGGADSPEEESAGEAGMESTEAQWKRRAEVYAARAVFSEARAAAAQLGVPENRLDRVAKLADTSGIDPEQPDAQGRIARAVRAVIRDLPELSGGAGTGTIARARRPRLDAFERGFLGN